MPSGGLPSVDVNLALRQFFSRGDIQERMLQMNTDRLYSEQGNRYYVQLGVYADKTAKHKRRVGLPDHYYTYYETGQTHDSLTVYPQETSVAIYPNHESAPDYANTLDGSAWGLTDPEMDELMPDVRDAVLMAIRNA